MTSDSVIYSAFLRKDGRYVPLLPPGAGSGYSLAKAVNDANIVAGYSLSDSGLFGWTFNGTDYRTYSYPGGAGDTYLAAINNVGELLGSFWNFNSVTNFIYTGTDYLTLPTPPDACSLICTYYTGMNDSGVLTGYYRDATTGTHEGFIATPAP
jgi:hypothetical protein